MKHLYFLLFTVIFSLNIHAQNAPFVTTWNVTSNSLNIAIPTLGTGYDYTVDFGDGTIQYNVTGNAPHTYSQPGVYTVSISGDFPRIYFNSGNVITSQSNSYKISSVEQWGDIQWQSMERAFKGCVNLVINATDIPDLSQVMNMSHMFDFNLSLNQPLDNWDVSSVTDMSSMFLNANSFNQPLNNWDVSNVTNMSRMFGGDGISFNQPLDNWDVSSVTDMNKMFSGAYLFDQSLNIWDVSNVTNMTGMFEAAFEFNQPLNNWNVSNVLSMDSMFHFAISFNQDISAWQINVSDLNLFLTYSGLDISNYDALLTKLSTLGLNNGTLGSDGLEYCNLVARNYLISTLGWTINGDSMYQNCNLSLAENQMEKIVIYPVPANDILYINIPGGIEITKIKLYTVQGQGVKILEGSFQEISVQGLASGVYFLKFYARDKNHIKQFIKK